MTLIDVWTGRHAAALQKALRKSNEAFAEDLGVATRTVANWNSRPSARLVTETAQILDTALGRASEDAKKTFAGILGLSDDAATAAAIPAAAQPLRVVIAVVCTGNQVLMVRTRNGAIGWQFPAGIV